MIYIMLTHQQSYSSVKPIYVEFENIRNELKKISLGQTHVYLIIQVQILYFKNKLFWKQAYFSNSLYCQSTLNPFDWLVFLHLYFLRNCSRIRAKTFDDE